MTFEPLQGIKYLIRNVDYRSCLQRRQTGNPVLRPERDEIFQHWTFAPVLMEDIRATPYRILDPYPVVFPLALQGSAAIGNAGNNSSWLMFPVSRRLGNTKFYIINIVPNPATGGFTSRILTTDWGHTLLTEPYTGDLNNVTQSTQYQWDIVQITPACLPIGANSDYRIRTPNGIALQLQPLPNNNVAVNLEPQDRRGSHRVWTITDFGNGNCTILHRPSGRYLAAHDTASFQWIFQTMTVEQYDAANAAGRSRATWKIQRTHGDFFTISIDLIIIHQNRQQVESFSLSLDQGNAILKIKKPAHNQLWLLEPDDVLLGQNPGNDDNPNNNPNNPANPPNNPGAGNPPNNPANPPNNPANPPNNPANPPNNPPNNQPNNPANPPNNPANPPNNPPNNPANPPNNPAGNPPNNPPNNPVPPELLNVPRRIRNTDTRRFYIRMIRDHPVYRPTTHGTFDWAQQYTVESRQNGALISCTMAGARVYLAYVDGRVTGVVNNFENHLWRIEPSGGAFFIIYNSLNLVLSVPNLSQEGNQFTLEQRTVEPRNLWEFMANA